MSSWFAQIRKDTSLGSVVKELSDRIAKQSPAIDDGDTEIRQIRSDEDAIAYTDTDSNYLDGTRTDTDTVFNTPINATQRMGTTFRVPGGDFLTFHIETSATKLRDFCSGSGGFFRSTDERAYVGYSQAS